ncbi:hypothetical protein, partial [Pseudoalteromonas sp. S3785]|uniref:hypothetical protein n=1 Tax=Pseudoalteromonas sp. S3785 TaxID=579545 RepID=UPI001BB15322
QYKPTNQEIFAPRHTQQGSACLAFIRRYRLFMGNNHTTQALPWLNTKQAAVNLTSKDKQSLVINNKIIRTLQN